MKYLIVVDMQVDFITGSLGSKLAEAIVPNAVEKVKNYDGKVIFTRDTHFADYMQTQEGKKLPVEHCIELTDGWMIDNRLMEVLDGKCTFVNKPTFGSFDLVEIINEDFETDKLDEIVLCGFCTDICCISCGLLLRAKFPNTKITVMKDLCAGTTKENHEAALKVMQSCQIDII